MNKRKSTHNSRESTRSVNRLPLFTLSHQGLNRQQAAHGQDQVLDEVLRALIVQQLAHNQRGVCGVDLQSRGKQSKASVL
jgi:hypothetical protein